MKNCIKKNPSLVVYKKWLSWISIAQLFRKKIVFWGASLFLQEFLKKYNIKTNVIIGIVDKNLSKKYTYLNGYKIFSPEEIENLKPNYVIFAIRNNHEKMYQEIKSCLHNYKNKTKLLPNEFIKLDRYNSRFNKAKAEQLKNLINNRFSLSRVVYLFQYSFFNQHGNDFFSGGAERYMLDLADLIVGLGYTPILLQAGNESLEQPWMREMNNLKIIGVNAQGKNFFEIINNLDNPALAIYSGIINWDLNIRYSNKIIISHGITWDAPKSNINVSYLKSVLDTFENIVSVDTSTISWFRSTFSKYIEGKNLNIKYVPNYVDTTKYYPQNYQRDKIKITYPRRCSEERGFWLFANIVPLLLERFSNILIEFVGYIHTDDIKNKIEELKNNFPELVSHKLCSQDIMQEIYQNTDISLIPTLYSEGTSLSCLEAMACGNTVIATNVGGLPNLIINNFNGILIEPNETSLYNAIISVLKNNHFRTSLAKNAIQISKAFAKENWDKEWLKILKKCLYK